jgi:hypothetical protein
MRWFAVAFMVFVTAITAAAQVGVVASGVGEVVGGGVRGILPVSPIAPIFYGFNNSVIDHTGRLLLFDVTYTYSSVPTGQPVVFRYPPKANTQVTIIESDGNTKRSPQPPFSGAFQVVGVGQQAVYAVVTDYSPITTSAQTPSITRHLKALTPSFPTINVSLPSIDDVPFQAEVKVSASGVAGAPDTIAFVDAVIAPAILGPAATITSMPTMPIRQRTVQIYQFDGTAFKLLTTTPITVP